MANKTIKMAALAAGVMAAMSANATTFLADFRAAGDSSSIATAGVEGSTVNGGLKIAAQDVGVEVFTTVNYNQDDQVTFTLSDGAWANRSSMQLWSSDGSSSVVQTTIFQGQDAKVLTFRLNESVPTASGSLVLRQGGTSGQPSFAISNIASGAKVTLGYGVRTQSSSTFNVDSVAAKTILTGIKQVYASIASSDRFNAKVSLNDNRLKLIDPTTATTKDTLKITLPLIGANVPNYGAITLGTNDTFDVVINSSDMTGIKDLVLGSKTVTPVNNTATFSGLSYNGAAGTGGSGSVTVTANVDGTTAINAKSFTASVTVKLDEEADQAALSNASAGSWTVNALEAIVSNMSLNSTGFLSWLRVVNEGKVTGDVNADITWTNGSESGVVTNVNLGKAEAEKIGTISEASILNAIGKSNATGVVEVSLHLTIDSPVDEVHIVSEKKASNGRLTTPVYYKGRSFSQ